MIVEPCILDPRGISADLFVLQDSGFSKFLSRKAPEPKSLFSKRSKWSLVSTAVAKEDPQVVVRQNQEKIREHSKSKVLNEYCPNEVASNTTPEQDAAADELLRYFEASCPKPDSSFWETHFKSPSNVDFSFDMTALDSLECGENIDSIRFSCKSSEETSSVDKLVLKFASSQTGSRDNTSSSSSHALLSPDVAQGIDTQYLEDMSIFLKSEFDSLQSSLSLLAEQSNTETIDKIDAIPISQSIEISKSDTSENGDELIDSLNVFDLERCIESQISTRINASASSSSSSSSASAGKIALWADQSYLDEAEFEVYRPKLALNFPFELDIFQKQAVMRLERKECVFVAAHTSAGKTVVAEYAIAMAKKHKTRTVYTSPIKALSNQKYRDFREKFDSSDVGLITGDVSVNPDASCLIMTTEILRSMLYRGADTVRDIEWVIFDEVHYVNDAERGVVWEEVIIMLPEHINLIFLSATTPNTMEFCDWIGRTKRRKVFVIATDKRPVPLQHFLYFEDDVYRLLSPETHGFNDKALHEASHRLKMKNQPKAKSTENAKMAADRQQEKLAMASQFTGKSMAILAKEAEKKASSSSSKPTSSSSVASSTNPSGSKAQWHKLIQVLENGGREESGGLREIGFGEGVKRRIWSKETLKKRNHIVPYEKLPLEIRESMTKREYEAQEIRDDEDMDIDVDNDGDLTSSTSKGIRQEVGLLPVVIFTFSKKKCEEACNYFNGHDLLKSTEKAAVRNLMEQVKLRLNPLDAMLSQVKRVEDMAMRGFGVHHGGLLPLLKECIEILFGQSIIKVLFATETFAMGLNMPARAVIFNGIRKHDGQNFRNLLPGEYTQMAGRAGRRGLDVVGTVILAVWNDNLPSEGDLRMMLTGKARQLTSQFRLSFGMILNLLRVHGLTVEEMIKRSFSEFYTQRALSHRDLATKLSYYERILDKLTYDWKNSTSLPCEDLRSELERYVNSWYACRSLHQDLLRMSPGGGLMKPGNIAWVFSSYLPCPCLAMIIQTVEKPNEVSSSSSNLRSLMARSTTSSATNSDSQSDVMIWVLIRVVGDNHGLSSQDSATTTAATAATTAQQQQQPSKSSSFATSFSSSSMSSKKKREEDNGMLSWTVKDEISGDWPYEDTTILGAKTTSATKDENVNPFQKISFWLKKVSMKEVVGVMSRNQKLSSCKQVSEVIEKGCAFMDQCRHDYMTMTGKALPWLDYSKELKISDVDYMIKHMEYQTCLKMIASNTFFLDETCLKDFVLQNKIIHISQKIPIMKHLISNENLSHFPEFQQRLSLLKLLCYVDPIRDTVNVKGRIACEINTCDELLATEMIFNNILEPLNPPEAAGILSAFVFQDKSEDTSLLTSRMEVAKSELKDILVVLENLQRQEGIDITGDNRPSLNFGLSGVVYEWARGKPFKDLMNMTEVQEGSIVRCITRLDELLKDIRNAARVVGNPSLYRKMEAASQCIRRDIVFAASLYIS